MNRDDVIRLAKQADASFETADSMFRFAALIESAATERANERANASWALMCEKMVAAEREAILADVVAPILAGCTVSKYATSRECASAREMAKAIDAAIRARGQK